MLNTIGQIGYNRMHVRTTRHLLQMQFSLCRITMRQHEVASRAFAPNFELIAPSCPSSAFIPLLKVNMFALQVLPDKERRRLHILSFVFNAKSIITSREREKECRSPTRKRIKDTQPSGRLLTKRAREDSNIEQNTREDFVGFALITPNLGHLHGHKWLKGCIKWPQERTLHVPNLLKIFMRLAGRSQARQYLEQVGEASIFERDQEIALPSKRYRLNALDRGS